MPFVSVAVSPYGSRVAPLRGLPGMTDKKQCNIPPMNAVASRACIATE
jgi:hypothetical protein